MAQEKEILSPVIHVMDRDNKNFFLWIMMCDLLSNHPLPWREDKDWSSEIYDANNKLVIKFPSTESSLDFIKFAEDFNKESETQNEELFKELGIENSLKKKEQ